MTSQDDERSLLEEQIAYYDARAPEYDATSTPPDDELALQGRRVEGALHRFRATGRVLEIASGTGRMTKVLVRCADSVTALDPSPRMIELNRAKVDSPKVTYVQADFFEWDPDGLHDAVVFGNWLTHVPPLLFDEFWDRVAACLEPDGRVFFDDETDVSWRHEDRVGGPGSSIVRRSLSDGTSHQLIKVFRDPAEIEAYLRKRGWDVAVVSTGAFYWAEGRRIDPHP